MKSARFIVIMAAAVLVCTAAYADNRLLPTDMLEPGRFFGELTYSFSSGSGELALAGQEVDVKSEEHRLQVHIGFGLADGVDVDIATPYLATGTTNFEADIGFGIVKIDSYAEGFDDTTFSVRFKLADRRANGADFLFGVIAVFPSGYRKDGELGVELGAIDVRPKRDYPGEGVISYGAGFAMSGSSGSFEPYMTGTYIFGGRRERHEIDEHYSDEAAVAVGLQAHTSPHAAFDIAFSASRNSPQTSENHGDRVRAAAFIAGGVRLAMYFEFAPDATFVLGVSYIMVESHLTDKDAGLRLRGVTSIVPTIGFHVLF